jgi:hypothetical protein
MVLNYIAPSESEDGLERRRPAAQPASYGSASHAF